MAASSITDGGLISDVVPFAAFATSSTVSVLVCLNCDWALLVGTFPTSSTTVEPASPFGLATFPFDAAFAASSPMLPAAFAASSPMLPAAFAASSAAPAPVLALPFDAAFAASSIKSSATFAALLASEEELMFMSGWALLIARFAALNSSFVIFPSLKSCFASLYLYNLREKSSEAVSFAVELELPFELAPFPAALAASSPMLPAAFAASSPILLAVLPASSAALATSSAAFATDDAPEPLLKWFIAFATPLNA